jgi:hypothetical protein
VPQLTPEEIKEEQLKKKLEALFLGYKTRRILKGHTAVRKLRVEY